MSTADTLERVVISEEDALRAQMYRLLAYFLRKLKATPDGEGSLLDNCSIVYGSGISDGNRHNHDDLPILLAGGRAAGFQTGRHMRFAEETPLMNLYLTMLQTAGVPITQVGDSTGTLDALCSA